MINLANASILLMAIVGLITILQWILEARFNLRKRIKSFEDYGRKRNLLKIQSNRLYQVLFVMPALLAMVIYSTLLISNPIYYWILGLPTILIVLGSLANYFQNQSFDLISIDTRFLEEEYFKIREIEDNVVGYKEKLVLLETDINQSQVRTQDIIDSVKDYLLSKDLIPDIQKNYNNLKSKISNQIETIDGSIFKFKDHFTLIAQEYIENKNRFAPNSEGSIKVEEVKTIRDELTKIDNDNINQIVRYINTSLTNKQLKKFTDYPKIVEILNELNYKPSVEDVMGLMDTYPLDSESDQKTFLDAVYGFGFINLDFFKQYIVPKDQAWFFNDSFYSNFSDTDIKKIFFQIIVSEADNIIDSILKSFNPKYISYLSDLTKLHHLSDELKDKIETYDDVLNRLNQFVNPYNREENYLIALQNIILIGSEKEELERYSSKDLSTPNISTRICEIYQEKIKDFYLLLGNVIDLYIAYKQLVSKNKVTSLFEIEEIIQYILEKIATLEENQVKLGILFIAFDLFGSHIPWHSDQKYKEIFQLTEETLNLHGHQDKYDKYLLESPKSIYNELIKDHPVIKKIDQAQLHGLIMRIEANRLFLEQLI